MRCAAEHSCLLNALGQLVLKTLKAAFLRSGSGVGSLAAALAISEAGLGSVALVLVC